jgi:hypothetical protein
MRALNLRILQKKIGAGAEKVFGFNLPTVFIKMKNYWQKDAICPGRYPGPELRILNWEGTDSLENFKKYTLFKRRDTQRQYRVDSITYEHNSYGYRTKEFEFNSEKPGILCLGCSFTYGTGNIYKEIWPSIIGNNYTDYNVYNLGWPGGSADTVVRILWSVGNKLNAKIICILWPSIYRFDLFHTDNIINANTQNWPELFSHEMLDKVHFQNLWYKNLAMMELLAEKYQWQVIQNNSDWAMNNSIDYGRDTHPGPETHKFISEYYINHIG